MRRLIALVAAMLLCVSPVLADVSVGNGSVGIPVAATQGGTGQTSFTTNCVIAASSSTALTCTGSPTISGANITSGTIPNAALVTNPDVSTCTTWTPTDQSGASLTLTVNSAYYCHTNNGDGTHRVFVQLDVTYPATADGSNARISLPFTASGSILGALAIGLMNPTITNLTSTTDTGTAKLLLWVGGTQETNALLSGKRLSIAGEYQCTT